MNEAVLVGAHADHELEEVHAVGLADEQVQLRSHLLLHRFEAHAVRNCGFELAGDTPNEDGQRSEFGRLQRYGLARVERLGDQYARPWFFLVDLPTQHLNPV